MISCKEAAKISSELLDHNVPIYRRVLLWLHLKACQTCFFYKRQIHALRKILCHYPETIEDDPAALSRDSQERMRHLIKQKIS